MSNQVNAVAVVIPALEPDDKLVILLKNLQEASIQNIVVVDDGTTSAESVAIFEEVTALGGTVLTHQKNKGKGCALKTAFSYCLAHMEGIVGVVTADADGQHTVEDIVACAVALQQEPNALIMGCRNFKQKDLPFHNKWGNMITRTAMSLFCAVKVSDTQTGLRAIPLAFMEHLLTVEGERYEFETNMLIETNAHNTKIVEVPIQAIYIDENKSSHFNLFQDSVRIYGKFLKFFMASTSSAVVDILLFLLFSYLLKPSIAQYIAFATVTARVCSAIFNYIVNSKMVFQKTISRSSMLKYFILSVLQMAVSAWLVTVLFATLHVPEVAIKVVVDVFLFIISYQIQHRFVFNFR